MFHARAKLAPLLGSQVAGEQPGRCSFWAKVPRNHTGSSLSGPRVLGHPGTVVCVAGAETGMSEGTEQDENVEVGAQAETRERRPPGQAGSSKADGALLRGACKGWANVQTCGSRNPFPLHSSFCSDPLH